MMNEGSETVRLLVEVRIRKGETATLLDGVMDKLVGRDSIGSGFDFASSTRDREYEFSSRRTALNAMDRVRKGLQQLQRIVKVRLAE